LRGVFCAVQSCPDPHCLHVLFRDDPGRHMAGPCQNLKEERTVCRFVNPIY
jgi:hypothetical protein